MHLRRTRWIPPPLRGFGDDATGDPAISTDSSGMSVVTITSGPSTGLPWYAWLIALAGTYYLLQSKPR